MTCVSLFKQIKEHVVAQNIDGASVMWYFVCVAAGARTNFARKTTVVLSVQHKISCNTSSIVCNAYPFHLIAAGQENLLKRNNLMKNSNVNMHHSVYNKEITVIRAARGCCGDARHPSIKPARESGPITEWVCVLLHEKLICAPYPTLRFTHTNTHTHTQAHKRGSHMVKLIQPSPRSYFSHTPNAKRTRARVVLAHLSSNASPTMCVRRVAGGWSVGPPHLMCGRIFIQTLFICG